MSMDALQLLRPWWLLALLLLPLLPWLWRRIGGAQGGWSRVVDPHLLAHQIRRGRRTRAPLLLALLAYALAVLALAGPAWRQAPQTLAQREAALALVLEVSDSMRAGDLQPDRLARARFALTDLLRSRRDGQFALVAYAGAAFTVAPVTDDGTTLLALLDALDPAQMPVGGANAAAALQHAADLLAGAGHDQGEILLVADGAGAAAEAAAAEARARGYRVSVLGVGTAAGAPVSLPQGGFLKDAAGEILVPGLESAALQRIAEAGGGRYAALQPGRMQLAALLQQRGGRYTDSADAAMRLVDDGPWLLLLLLPLAAVAFRRGWLGCWVGGLLLWTMLPQPAQAMDWTALWQRDDQRAWQALAAGDAERAAALADAPALRGSALYRAGEHQQAAEAFAQVGSADAHYNRGNALARAQRFEDALAAYDAALALQPGMGDAQANRAAVEEWLRRQQSQSQSGENGQPQDGQQQDGQQQDAGQKDGEQKQGQQQGEQGQPSGEAGGQQPPPGDGQQPPGSQGDGEPGEEDPSTPQPGEQGEETEQQRREREQRYAEAMQQALQQQQPADANGEPVASELEPAEREQRQAVEQWLRRVPDDPGGLLRRKFAIEHQRRMREGEGQ